MKLLLLATDRYSININDFYMFYRRTGHEIVGLVHHVSCPGKSWWRKNRFKDPARLSIFDRMDFGAMKLFPWSTPEELTSLLRNLDFDYLCMGNGTGADHRVAIECVGRERCLFTEYGWLPWSENFYIARAGCGVYSDLAQVSASELDQEPIDEEAIEGVQRKLKSGWPIFSKGFVYVPLQKDVNDFKFTLTHFRSNEEFLDFVHETVPKSLKVWVKRHPLYNKKYNLSKYGRFVDVSGRRLNKAALYQRMQAMVCINSTSILEALLFNANVFAYGEDLYQGKDLVHFRVDDPQAFESKLNGSANPERAKRFVSSLLRRQVNRQRCVDNDRSYIENHYWNAAI